MQINKTDVVFGLSTLAGLTTLIMKTGGNLLTNTETLWFGLISGVFAFLAYAFYDFFEGTTPPPTPPFPSPPPPNTPPHTEASKYVQAKEIER